jgi:hypothetical protein
MRYMNIHDRSYAVTILLKSELISCRGRLGVER